MPYRLPALLIAAAIVVLGTVGSAGSATAATPFDATATGMPTPAATTAATTASWPSAGHDLGNTRNNPDETIIGPTTVAGLKQKWAVGFPTYLTSTPIVAGSTVFLPDQGGNMSAFDTASGGLIWRHTIASYTGITNDIVRVAPAVADGRAIFGDQPYNGPHTGVHLVAVSAATGALLWDTVVDTQPTAKLTGSPVVDGTTVYLGMSSGDEVDPQCCHFRGSVIAVDATTGKIKWRTYTVPVGYTGAAVWGSAPVVNHTTNLLYVGTGNNYTVPAGVCTTPAQAACTPADPTDYVDSLLALDLTTGKPAWALRTLNGDVWTKVCTSPTTCGPDFDFGSSPNLFTATIGGTTRQLVGIGQKSGIYWVADARTGQLQWHTKVGPGGAGGGIQWGPAWTVPVSTSRSSTPGMQPGRWHRVVDHRRSVQWLGRSNRTHPVADGGSAGRRRLRVRLQCERRGVRGVRRRVRHHDVRAGRGHRSHPLVVRQRWFGNGRRGHRQWNRLLGVGLLHEELPGR